jgi:CMP-N-acetylneuraminic acid synthetase
MLRGQKVTAIIPARGGSKGIPRKNLYRLGNDTLLERAIKIGISCSRVDQVLVSTDDLEMFTIAGQYGVASSGLRPEYLATDNATTIDVIIDMINTGEIKDGLVLLLQVTSPLRTLGDLNLLMDEYEMLPSGCSAMASVVKFDSPHPDKIQVVENGYLRSYVGKESMVSRQSLPPVFALNGAFYINTTQSILDQKTMLPRKTMAYEMGPMKSLNLDSNLDLIMLNSLVQTGIVSLEEY